MHTFPPVRAPKSQLAIGKPLTGGLWNSPKKRCSCPKTKEKLQQDSRRGAITIKSNPIPVGCASHTLEKNNTKEGCESSEPHIRLPSQGIRRKGCESPGNLTLRASEGVWLQNFHRVGRNRDSILGGHKQNRVGTRTQGEGAVTPTGDWSRPSY